MTFGPSGMGESSTQKGPRSVSPLTLYIYDRPVYSGRTLSPTAAAASQNLANLSTVH